VTLRERRMQSGGLGHYIFRFHLAIAIVKTGQLVTGTEGQTFRHWLINGEAGLWREMKEVRFCTAVSVLRTAGSRFRCSKVDYRDRMDGACVAESPNVGTRLYHRDVKWQGTDIQCCKWHTPKGLIEWIINTNPVAYTDNDIGTKRSTKSLTPRKIYSF
jgi:hypothetical protein